MTFEWFTIKKFCRVKDGSFRGCKALRATSGHQTHPVIFESGGVAFPSAGLVGGDCGQDQGINIILPPGFNEYSSETMRHFRIELVRIDRCKRPDVFLRGAARDLQSQCKRQYGPGSHAVLLPRKPTSWQASFSKALTTNPLDNVSLFRVKQEALGRCTVLRFGRDQLEIFGLRMRCSVRESHRSRRYSSLLCEGQPALFGPEYRSHARSLSIWPVPLAARNRPLNKRRLQLESSAEVILPYFSVSLSLIRGDWVTIQIERRTPSK
jgi:hypothetical protein